MHLCGKTKQENSPGPMPCLFIFASFENCKKNQTVQKMLSLHLKESFSRYWRQQQCVSMKIWNHDKGILQGTKAPY